MIFVNILLGIIASFILLFVVGTPKPPMSPEKHRNVTLAFVAVLIFIIAVNVIA